MTPEDLVAEARRQVGAVRSRPPTRTELWLATRANILEEGCSKAFLQVDLRVNLMEKTKLPPLKVDGQDPVT